MHDEDMALSQLLSSQKGYSPTLSFARGSAARYGQVRRLVLAMPHLRTLVEVLAYLQVRYHDLSYKTISQHHEDRHQDA